MISEQRGTILIKTETLQTIYANENQGNYALKKGNVASKNKNAQTYKTKTNETVK